MTLPDTIFLLLLLLFIFVLILNQSNALTIDGILLLSFKNATLSDPKYVLSNWNSNDYTPCSWNGVVCSPILTSTNTTLRVTSLNLPNSDLIASIPSDLGSIEHLQVLDLSNNSLNGSLPSSFFQPSSLLQSLNFSSNSLSGDLPQSVTQLRSLQFLNLSDNNLAGKIPDNLSNLQNLTLLGLRNNYFSGFLPTELRKLQILDLSFNLLNGTLPSNFGGDSIAYFNVSYNRFSGEISPEFAERIPTNATLDFSFNDFTGEIPVAFFDQEKARFAGNDGLCGEPTRKLCPIPSSPSSAPNNASSPTSAPAIAAIPKTFDNDDGDTPMSSSSNAGSYQQKQQQSGGLRRGTVIGIVVGDIVGIGILAIIFAYVYKRKKEENAMKDDEAELEEARSYKSASSSSTTSESKGFTRWSCLRKRTEEEESSDTAVSSESGAVETAAKDAVQNYRKGHEEQKQQLQNKTGTLVTVDGEKELEVETLLKASAYILGATGSSIMYKAVLEDGTSLAVRRIGESGVERFKDFENQVKVIAKLVHPNLVRIRGFYWGHDEKLIIYDFVPNGCLANVRYRKVGSSPSHLPWEVRLKIAKGVARGLSYLHEKKHVHGNLKPSNILLGTDMEPKIGDFGLEKIVTSYKAGGSARIFGSKRSTASRDSFQDTTFGPSPSPSPSSIGGVSPYSAPESLRNLKAHPKWDVYSFGVIFLELLTGKVVILDDMGQVPGLLIEDKNRALRMADVAIRVEMEGKEEALLSCFKLGYNCVSNVPQKRPPMKEVLQVLDKIPLTSSLPYYYNH